MRVLAGLDDMAEKSKWKLEVCYEDRAEAYALIAGHHGDGEASGTGKALTKTLGNRIAFAFNLESAGPQSSFRKDERRLTRWRVETGSRQGLRDNPEKEAVLGG